MNKNSKKISYILMIAVMFLSTGCATGKVAVYGHNNYYQHTHFKHNTKYEVITNTSSYPIKVQGQQLSWQGSVLYVRSETGSVQSRIHNSQIVAINEYQQDSKKLKNKLVGAGIGAGTGMALALIPAVLQQTKNCSASGDPGDCRNMRTFYWGMVPVSGLVFGLAGLGIGSLFKSDTN